LVYALVRSNDGAKLPSGGLQLNASKLEAGLDRLTIFTYPDVGRYSYAGRSRPAAHTP
jgi:hypothetical protein